MESPPNNTSISTPMDVVISDELWCEIGNGNVHTRESYCVKLEKKKKNWIVRENSREDEKWNHIEWNWLWIIHWILIHAALTKWMKSIESHSITSFPSLFSLLCVLISTHKNFMIFHQFRLLIGWCLQKASAQMIFILMNYWLSSHSNWIAKNILIALATHLIALAYHRPASMVWSWLLCSRFTR